MNSPSFLSEISRARPESVCVCEIVRVNFFHCCFLWVGGFLVGGFVCGGGLLGGLGCMQWGSCSAKGRVSAV